MRLIILKYCVFLILKLQFIFKNYKNYRKEVRIPNWQMKLLILGTLALLATSATLDCGMGSIVNNQGVCV